MTTDDRAPEEGSVPPVPADQRGTCVQTGCGRPIAWSNRHGWLHNRPAWQDRRLPPAEQLELATAAVADHPARRFGPPTLPPRPTGPSVLRHPGCGRAHTGLGEVRRCAGGWVNNWNVDRVPLPPSLGSRDR